MLLNLLALLTWLPALACLWSARRRLRCTTLVPAWRWSVAAGVMWTVALAGQLVPARELAVAASSVWWLACVATLCPMVAALGARRPNVRVWTWFILLPLLAVFGWPVLVFAVAGDFASSLSIPLPLTLGFALVLLMGAGNYIATRYALSAALTIAGVCLAAAPAAEAAPQLPWSAETSRSTGAIAIALAIVLASRQSRRPTWAESDVERIWFDYRDTFGIVWGRRFLERVNARGVAEDWPCRLADNGLVWTPGVGAEAKSATLERVDFTFRWLLRRFVDPEWIDARASASELEMTPKRLH